MIGDTPSLSEDYFMGGRVRVRQPKTGYRAGMDAMVLAAAVDPAETLMEAGCGAGAALLAVAWRHQDALITGIERDPVMAAIAKSNVADNACNDRVRVLEADALNAESDTRSFGGIFCNPPFDQPGEGNAPHPGRVHAYLTDEGPDRWIAALSNRLAGGAALTLIQRARHAPVLLKALEGRLGGAQLFPLRPFAGAPAKRVLLRAVKGSRAPFQLWGGIDLHEKSGVRHTQEAQALLAGNACIDWRSGQVRPN